MIEISAYNCGSIPMYLKLSLGLGELGVVFYRPLDRPAHELVHIYFTSRKENPNKAKLEIEIENLSL